MEVGIGIPADLTISSLLEGFEVFVSKFDKVPKWLICDERQEIEGKLGRYVEVIAPGGVMRERLDNEYYWGLTDGEDLVYSEGVS